jgi:hypothetical protein
MPLKKLHTHSLRNKREMYFTFILCIRQYYIYTILGTNIPHVSLHYMFWPDRAIFKYIGIYNRLFLFLLLSPRKKHLSHTAPHTSSNTPKHNNRPRKYIQTVPHAPAPQQTTTYRHQLSLTGYFHEHVRIALECRQKGGRDTYKLLALSAPNLTLFQP